MCSLLDEDGVMSIAGIIVIAQIYQTRILKYFEETTTLGLDNLSDEDSRGWADNLVYLHPNEYHNVARRIQYMFDFFRRAKVDHDQRLLF